MLFSLTLSQRDIFFDQEKNSKSPFYNIGGYIRLRKVNVDRLIEAHGSLVELYDVFGLRIKVNQDGVFQYVSQKRNTELPVIDFSAENEPSESADLWLKSLFTTPQEYLDTELFQAYLLKLGDQEYRYIGFAHHLIMDGWGFANWAKRLGEIYNDVAELAAQVSWLEIAEKDIDYQKSAKFEKDKIFWQSHCSKDAVNPLVPFYQKQYEGTMPRPSGREIVNIDSNLFIALKEVASSINVGVNHLFLGVLSAYFSLTTEQSELIFGVLTHNRKNHALKQMLGVFISANPLSISVDTQQSFTALARGIASAQKAALRHQRYPIGDLIKDLGKSGQEGSFFDIGFNYLKLDSELTFEGEVADLVYLSHEHEKTPVMVTIWEYGETNSVEIQIDYNFCYFQPAEAVLLGRRFEWLLRAICETPQIQVADLPLIPEQERQFLLSSINNTQADINVNTLPELFQKQASIYADNVAVRFGGETLTYAQLQRKVNSVAVYLTASGVKENTLVGVCLERSIDLVVALLGIMQSGAAYLPLDPDYPLARLHYMLTDSQVSHVITQPSLEVFFSEQVGLRHLIHFEQIRNKNHAEKRLLGSQTPCLANANSLAYVIYTSGSTGNPKGVMVEQHNVVNLLLSMQKEPGLSAESKVLSVTPTSFDIHVLEIFLPLISGAELVLCSKEQSVDPLMLCELVKRHQITLMQATPTTWQMVKESGCWQGMEEVTVLSGGEPLPFHLACWLSDTSASVWNLYGPTETTVWSTAEQLEKNFQRVTIGKPIANTQCYVVNRALELLPIGVTGELVISGEGLTRGYLGKDALTADKFVTNPFDGEKRLYHTGDMARVLSDGRIECLGRFDDQVKLRGFRIELEEIDYQLKKLDVVVNAITVIKTLDSGEQSMLAFTILSDVLESEFDQERIKECLAKVLPAHMIPDSILTVKCFPTTPSGKTDKKALLSSARVVQSRAVLLASSDTELALANTLGELLDLTFEEVDFGKSLLQLGGHSLIAVKLIADIKSRFGAKISMSEIFSAVTIRDLAKRITERQSLAANNKVIKPVNRALDLRLSFSQERLWFLKELEGVSSHYNMAKALKINGCFNVDLAEKVLSAIIERHEILRTTYHCVGGLPKQQIQSPFSFYMEREDLSDLFEQGQCNTLHDIIDAFISYEFDLFAELPIRATFVYLNRNSGNESGVLMINMHHIASDGWSIGIFVAEFQKLYTALIEGKSIDTLLPPLAIQYADYAHWQRTWLTESALASQLSYWQTQLD
ncbi:non-ribosomal peptide synthetase, partial [Pseudoalteromonas sp. P1-9]|uniref:non-ribosomal peptide synthetase n=1 Tax=Pseudoalteromonas sp. P1-9 TaxID=1710354 RepID=UPI0006D61C51